MQARSDHVVVVQCDQTFGTGDLNAQLVNPALLVTVCPLALACGIQLGLIGRNISVVLGMMPTKGIPLPLVSYGGSSLFVTLACVGVLLNITKQAE